MGIDGKNYAESATKRIPDTVVISRGRSDTIITTMSTDPPSHHHENHKACIYVCQSSACRSMGSDVVLMEIQELAKIVGNCDVKPTRCLSRCTQSGPVVAVKRYGYRTKMYMKINTFEKSASILRDLVNTVGTTNNGNNSTTATATSSTTTNTISSSNQQQQQQQQQSLPLKNLFLQTQQSSSSENSSTATTTRRRISAKLHDAQIRRHYVSTYQWNKALSGLMSSLITPQSSLTIRKSSASDTELILRKAGYPGTNPSDWFDGSKRNRITHIMPTEIVGYALWTLKSVEVVSNHSAVFRFATDDRKRGTPHPRGSRKIFQPNTWHVTMLGEVGSNSEGPLPWIERAYSPISSAADWEAGKCDILIKIYNRGQLTSWLQRRTSKLIQTKNIPNGILKYGANIQIWLSKPIKTLNVPSLTIDDDDRLDDVSSVVQVPSSISSSVPVSVPSSAVLPSLQLKQNQQQPFSSVLLLLGGTGIVSLPQIMAHHAGYDSMKMLGIPNNTISKKSSQLNCPVDLIQSCYDDDLLLLPQIQQYCLDGMIVPNPHHRGIRNYTLLTQRRRKNKNNHSENSNDHDDDVDFDHPKEEEKEEKQQGSGNNNSDENDEDSSQPPFRDGFDRSSRRIVIGGGGGSSSSNNGGDGATTPMPMPSMTTSASASSFSFDSASGILPHNYDIGNSINNVHGKNETILKEMYYANIMSKTRLDTNIVANAIGRLRLTTTSPGTGEGGQPSTNNSNNFRVIVSGPIGFNKIASKCLQDCHVHPSQITILPA